MSEDSASTTRARISGTTLLVIATDDEDIFFDAPTRASVESWPSPGKVIVNDPKALVRVVKRLCATRDTLCFRTEGGLRLMLRHGVGDEDDKELAFDVSFVVDPDTEASVLRCLKNEIDLESEESGDVFLIDDFVLDETDDVDIQEAVDALHDINLWTICPCGEYLIKDLGKNPGATMCYFCDLTAREADESEDTMCPICHEPGNVDRWMVRTSCCKQRMHKRCKAKCVDAARGRPKCPMCRAAW